MFGLPAGDLIEIPEGWETINFIERVVSAGLCSYMDLESGAVGVTALFRMFRLLDYRRYLKEKAREAARDRALAAEEEKAAPYADR